MELIPVIDLADGVAVAAAGGDRAGYRPLASPLCASARPADVARGLVAATGARTLYVADLDAIGGRAPQMAALDAIRRAAPGLALWVDAGFHDARSARAFARGLAYTPVLGSETARSLPDGAGGYILSLDFRAGPLGEAALLDMPERWPPTVIAMCLAQVGAAAGPDLAITADICRRAGTQRRVFAAGGVRNAADLAALAALGCAGALVATALHGGTLP